MGIVCGVFSPIGLPSIAISAPAGEEVTERNPVIVGVGIKVACKSVVLPPVTCTLCVQS